MNTLESPWIHGFECAPLALAANNGTAAVSTAGRANDDDPGN